jgi:hypothetical protein
MFGKCSGLACARPIPSLRDSIEPQNHRTERENAGASSTTDAPSPVPDRFELTSEDRAFAVSVGVPQDRVEQETQKFLARRRGRGDRRADWGADWREWMCRYRDLHPAAGMGLSGVPAANGASGDVATDGGMAAWKSQNRARTDPANPIGSDG